MRKFNLWFSLIALIVIGVGTYLSPGEGLFWLASPEMSAQIIRGGLAVFVILQLITEPPRHAVIRALTGVASMATAAWALHTTTMMTTPIFDTFLYIQAAIALGITALELPEGEPRVLADKQVVAK